MSSGAAGTRICDTGCKSDVLTTMPPYAIVKGYFVHLYIFVFGCIGKSCQNVVLMFNALHSVITMHGHAVLSAGRGHYKMMAGVCQSVSLSRAST